VDPAKEATPALDTPSESELDRVYLDLTPVKSFLYSPSGGQAQASSSSTSLHLDHPTEALPADPDPEPTLDEPCVKSPGDPEEQV
jgi:hypothetical protein